MSDMIEINVPDLVSEALDWAVAKALGATFGIETFVYRGQHGTKESDAGDYARIEGLGHFGSMWAAIRLDRHAIHPAWRSTSDKIWRPSTKWEQGGPLIERQGVTVEYALVGKGDWHAYVRNDEDHAGFYADSPLVAAMLAIVAANLGERVAVPADLVAHNMREPRQ